MTDFPQIKHPADLPAHFAAVLAAWPRPAEYLLAVSGGADSLALLFLFHGLAGTAPARWRVLHVDHGLNPDSQRWAEYVAKLCRELEVHCEIRRVVVEAGGPSPEALARKARYAALSEAMRPDTMVLTAHHLDDQAETVLLRLLRGAGGRGLAAIDPLRRFGSGWLGRPLLAVRRNVLRTYLQNLKVEWVEDSGNLELKHDRNFLRHRILPELARRWPAAVEKIAASAAQLREVEALLAGYDSALLAGARRQDHLALKTLAGLSALQRRRVVRLWCESIGHPPPPARRLEVFLEQAITAPADRRPSLSWPAGALSRYRDGLYFIPAKSWAAAAWAGGAKRWADLTQAFCHPRIGSLAFIGPPPATWPLLWIDIRRGGESLVVGDNVRDSYDPGKARNDKAPIEDSHELSTGDSHHRRLKKWWQDVGEPPWRRGHWPLLYHGAAPGALELWAAGDRLLARQCRNWLAATGLELIWRPPWLAAGSPHLLSDPDNHSDDHPDNN